MEERTIDISKYIQARSQEIQHFTKQLDQKLLQQNKLPYQMVPKHLRRRAMSHNRYRIPIRIRKNMEQKDLDLQENTQDPIKCRKSIRKPKLLMEAYKRRSKEFKWLESHLWHAKRMKMINYFGYKVALHPNDKSSRACYRFAKKETCIHDKSFYGFLFIEGQNIKEFLQIFVAKKDILKIFSKNRINGEFSTNNIELFQEQEKINLIGIVDFIWQQDKLIMIYHPGCKQEIEEIVKSQENKNCKFTFIENNFNIIDITGPETMKKIQLLFENLQFKNENLIEIREIFKTVNDPCQYQNEKIIYINSMGKISQKLITPPQGFFQNIQEIEQNQYLNKDQDKIQLCIQKLINPIQLTQNLNTNNNIKSFWEKIEDFNPKKYDLRYKVTNRSRYTHRKKNKITSKAEKQQQQKEKVGGKQKQQELQKMTQEELEKQFQKQKEEYNEKDEQFQMEIEKQQKFREQMKMDRQFDIVLIINNASQGIKNSFGSVKMILPQNEGHIIWKMLNFIACKPIGLENARLILQEQNLKCFPEDYPTTQTYKNIQNQNCNEIVAKYIRKPPGNRVNYEKLNSPFPFKPNWDYLINNFYKNLKQEQDSTKIQEENNQQNQEQINLQQQIEIENNENYNQDQVKEKENQNLKDEYNITILYQDLQEVNIQMIQRGIAFQNAYICLPTEQDLNNYMQMVNYNQPISHVHIEQSQNKSKEKSQKQSQKQLQNENLIQNNDLANQMSRQIIGFITSGGFCLQNGSGSGKGQILKYYTNIETGSYVLLRNPNSQFYFMGIVKFVN